LKIYDEPSSRQEFDLCHAPYKRGQEERRADMDKLKWAFTICAVLAILGLAVIPMTGQQEPNRVVALFGSLTIVLGLWLLARTLLRKRNRSK
jgi:hypothetical protein